MIGSNVFKVDESDIKKTIYMRNTECRMRSTLTHKRQEGGREPGSRPGLYTRMRTWYHLFIDQLEEAGRAIKLWPVHTT